MAFRGPEILPFGTEILYDPYFSIILNRKMDLNNKPNCSQKGIVLYYFDHSNTYEIVGMLSMMKGFTEIIHYNGVKAKVDDSNKDSAKRRYKIYTWKAYVEVPINSMVLFDPFYDNNILNLDENRPNPILYGIVQDYNSATKNYTVSIVNSRTQMEVSRNAIAEAGADYELVLKRSSTIPALMVILSIVLIICFVLYAIVN